MDIEESHRFIGGTMKIGSLIYYKECPNEWGFILKKDYRSYLVYWHDGDQSWIGKHRIALLEVQ